MRSIEPSAGVCGASPIRRRFFLRLPEPRSRPTCDPYKTAGCLSVGQSVLMMGLCGGLVPKLKLGDVVLYDEGLASTSYLCDRDLTAQLQALLHMPIVRGVTSDRVISTTRDKQQLANHSSADVVDMESAAALEILNESAFPLPSCALSAMIVITIFPISAMPLMPRVLCSPQHWRSRCYANRSPPPSHTRLPAWSEKLAGVNSKTILIAIHLYYTGAIIYTW